MPILGKNAKERNVTQSGMLLTINLAGDLCVIPCNKGVLPDNIPAVQTLEECW